MEARCHSLGVELETMTSEGAKLRNPMEILKELSQVYNSLPDSSVDKQGIISDIGGKYHANALAALLSNWTSYEKCWVNSRRELAVAYERPLKPLNHGKAV